MNYYPPTISLQIEFGAAKLTYCNSRFNMSVLTTPVSTAQFIPRWPGRCVFWNTRLEAGIGTLGEAIQGPGDGEGRIKNFMADARTQQTQNVKWCSFSIDNWWILMISFDPHNWGLIINYESRCLLGFCELCPQICARGIAPAQCRLHCFYFFWNGGEEKNQIGFHWQFAHEKMGMWWHLSYDWDVSLLLRGDVSWLSTDSSPKFNWVSREKAARDFKSTL